MAGTARKRPHEGGGRVPAGFVSKKRRKQLARDYHSGSEESDDNGGDEGFDPVNLLDSDDDDIHNATVDDGAPSDSEDAGSSSGEEDDDPARQKQPLKKRAQNSKGKVVLKTNAKANGQDQQSGDNGAESGEEEGREEDDEEGGDSDDDDADDSDDDMPSNAARKSKSKRNDPSAFATSLSKILSTKLSTTKRADPVLARSAEANEASRALVDATLEAKARRQIRDHRRIAKDKGRVRDVLVGKVATGKPEPVRGGRKNMAEEEDTVTAAQVQETERRLRKVAQRGVVRLFNAVRAAQVSVAEAENVNKKEGVLGMGKRENKVQELSKKGFLELIASGGGKLKKGGLEEA